MRSAGSLSLSAPFESTSAKETHLNANHRVLGLPTLESPQMWTASLFAKELSTFPLLFYCMLLKHNFSSIYIQQSFKYITKWVLPLLLVLCSLSLQKVGLLNHYKPGLRSNCCRNWEDIWHCTFTKDFIEKIVFFSFSLEGTMTVCVIKTPISGASTFWMLIYGSPPLH